MDSNLLKEFTRALESEKQKLTEELKLIAKPDPDMRGNWNATYPKFEPSELGSHSSLEQEQDEVEEYEVRLEEEHSLESRLLRVTNALARIAHGSYGKCAVCGKEISVARLRANPEAECDIQHEPKD